MIKWLIIALIGLIILGNLGFDVKKALENTAAQNNINFAKELVVIVWNKYLKNPAEFIWKEVFIKYIWSPTLKKLDDKMQGTVKEKLSTDHKVLFSIYWGRISALYIA
jgi:hypothetical protein